ncbi:MAG: hypothetical protein JWP85_1224 [Rhodoglobus sp.]|nr:hypothetical protein [Rhodoglobus sp.]
MYPVGMLSENSYSREYIDTCRARVASQVAAFDKLAGVDPEFEHAYFNNMVIVLNSYFTNRMRGMEGKDGNPLNEVRVLSNSMMGNRETVAADSAITWRPEATVLGLDVGDSIRIDRDGFVRLADAFFAELEGKYLHGV